LCGGTRVAFGVPFRLLQVAQDCLDFMRRREEHGARTIIRSSGDQNVIFRPAGDHIGGFRQVQRIVSGIRPAGTADYYAGDSKGGNPQARAGVCVTSRGDEVWQQCRRCLDVAPCLVFGEVDESSDVGNAARRRGGISTGINELAEFR
jgi:hypothetical protein